MSGETTFTKILVCDDDRHFRQRLARSLRTAGYTVFEAEDAHSALNTAADYHPDGVLLDMRMPGEGGLWLIPRLLEVLPDVRIVVLTGFGSIQTALEAVRLGAINYLTKPITIEKIQAGFFPERQSPQQEAELPSLAEIEHEYVNRVLAEHDGNVSQAAKVLGVHRRSLQRKLRREMP